MNSMPNFYFRKDTDMKFNKTLAAAAVAGVVSAGAHAQSSVTLYGSLDAGIGYVNKVGGGPLWVQTSGALSDTYFGLRGVEDLGGGTGAIFKLESGFNLGNGRFGSWGSNIVGDDSSTMFNRQAYVGLQNARYGAFTLGRQYDSVVDYLSPLSLAGKGVNLAAHPFNNDNIGAQYSINNSIKYESPDYAGFHFGGMYGFSNSPGNVAGGRQWSVGMGYGNGPFKVAAVYDQVDNSALGGALANNGDAVIAAGRQRTFGVGGNYTYGPATVGLLWTRSKFHDYGGALGGSSIRFDNIEASGVYSLTPALALVGSYTFTYAGTNSPDQVYRWHSVTAGADYSLSKRTDFYLAGVYQHAASGYAGPASADYLQTNIAGMIPASGTQNQVGIVSGVRVKF